MVRIVSSGRDTHLSRWRRASRTRAGRISSRPIGSLSVDRRRTGPDHRSGRLAAALRAGPAHAAEHRPDQSAECLVTPRVLHRPRTIRDVHRVLRTTVGRRGDEAEGARAPPPCDIQLRHLHDPGDGIGRVPAIDRVPPAEVGTAEQSERTVSIWTATSIRPASATRGGRPSSTPITPSSGSGSRPIPN
jgi:hypothetical protein